MTGQKEFIAQVVSLLDQAGIAYMVVGSVASTMYAEPRATLDVDIVIDAQWPQIEAFPLSLGSDVYVSREAAMDALARRSMFNVIDPSSGQKADLIFRGNRPFDAEEFGRRVPGILDDLKLTISSPEDVILAKLAWGKGAQSQRQFRDALSVAVTQWEKLDMAYLDHWAEQLDITELWSQTKADAIKIKGPPTT